MQLSAGDRLGPPAGRAGLGGNAGGSVLLHLYRGKETVVKEKSQRGEIVLSRRASMGCIRDSHVQERTLTHVSGLDMSYLVGPPGFEPGTFCTQNDEVVEGARGLSTRVLQRPSPLKTDSDGFLIIPDFQTKGRRFAAIGGKSTLGARRQTLEDLVSFITSQVEYNVMGSEYDFVLRWVSESPYNRRAALDLAGPTLSEALWHQLGLRLERVKGPIDVVVVDHLNSPARR
jgi:hypothetical protein